MAIQKKSLIGKRQSVKKALVAKSVSADAPKAEQIKSPNLIAGHHKSTYVAHKQNTPFVAHKSNSPFVAHKSNSPFVAHKASSPFSVRSTYKSS